MNAASGDTAPLYDAAAMETALAALPGVSRADAATASRAPLEFNATYTSVVVTLGDDLYFYDFTSRRAARLTTQAPATRRKCRSAPTDSSSRSCATTTCTPWTWRRRASAR